MTTQEITSDLLQEVGENLNSIIITEVEQSTVALLATSAESSQTTAQTALSDDQDTGKTFFPPSLSVISQPASQVIEGAKVDNPAASVTVSSEACTEIQAHQTTDRADIGNLYS